MYVEKIKKLECDINVYKQIIEQQEEKLRSYDSLKTNMTNFESTIHKFEQQEELISSLTLQNCESER